MNRAKIEITESFKRMVFSTSFYFLLRLILGGIFIFSGTVKLADTYKFAEIIYEYGILPDYLINPAAVGLPLFEIIAGLGLVFNIKYSLESITIMLIMFIGVLWFGILKDLNIDCGCFSADEISEQGSLWRALYRDLVFMAISMFLFISQRINRRNRPVYIIFPGE